MGGLPDAEEFADCREDVDVRDGEAYDPVAQTGVGDDQRNPERRVVGQETVRAFAVLAQRFAVVPSQDDERGTDEAASFEISEEFSERGVDIGHFSVVRTVQEPGFVRFRGGVGFVGVPEMNPEKPGSFLALEPGERARQDSFRPAGPAIARRRACAVETVIIGVETLVEPETGFERESADERPGRIPRTLEVLGQRQEFVPDDEIGVIMDAVREGCRAQKDVGVRGEGSRAMRKCPGEDDSPGGQAVNPRRADVPVGIKADPVGAECVNRDQKQVEPGRRAGRGADSKQRENPEDHGSEKLHPRQCGRAHVHRPHSLYTISVLLSLLPLML